MELEMVTLSKTHLTNYLTNGQIKIRLSDLLKTKV